jgi:ribulose-5-phosphate 4-epimerase/fuculose-1-phosphate aldolase
MASGTACWAVVILQISRSEEDCQLGDNLGLARVREPRHRNRRLAMNVMTPVETSALTIREQVSEEEWALRVDLAAAYRLVAYYGWDDLIFTHLSARVPGPEHHFLINPYTHMFDEITASSLVKIDVEGNRVMDVRQPVNKAGFVIHSAVHMGRDDAHAVLHLHTPHGQAVSAMAEGLLPHTQTAMIAMHDVAYHDFEGIATELDERERLVADLGTKNAMILRNHGTLTVGESVAQAFLRMYYLERACEAQVLMLSAGRAGLHEPNQGVAEKVETQTAAPGMKRLAEGLAWPALLRKLDRIDPSFRH